MSTFRRCAGVSALALLCVSPAPALDLQHSKVPARLPGYGTPLTDGELFLNGADERMAFKNVDGTIGLGSLLDAVPAGRKAVEQADANDRSIITAGASASQTTGAWLTSLLWGPPTATSLRSFPRAIIFDGAIVDVPGYTTAGDGGGGTFRWSAGSTAADDGVLVFAPVAGSGRWLRVFDGTLPARATGARCDGSSTSDSVRIQAGLDALAAYGGGELRLSPADKCTASGLTWTTPQRLDLRGVGPNSILVAGSPTAPILTATAGYVTVTDLTVFAPVDYKTAGAFFAFSGCSCQIGRISFLNGWDLATWGTGATNAQAVDIIANDTRHGGFKLDVSPGSGQQYGIAMFSRVRMQGDAKTLGDALTLVSGDTVIVTDSNLAGFVRGVVAKPVAGRGYLTNLFFSNVLVDGAGGPTNAGDGWTFDGTEGPLTRVNIVNSWSSLMGGQGMRFKNMRQATIATTRVMDSRGNGVLLETGAKQIDFRLGVVSGNGAASPGNAHGIVILAGANDITVTGTRSGPSSNDTDGSEHDTQGCGIVITDPSVTDLRIEGNDLRGNLTGGAKPYGLCDNTGGSGTTAAAGAATSTATKFISGNRVGPYAP